MWWDTIFGEYKTIDTKKYCVICPNIPGSPYGSTCPLSLNPDTGKEYFYDFPIFTPSDVADIFEFLKQHLHISQIKFLLSASMGGMVALQWAVSYPKSIQHLVVIGADAQISPWMAAMHSVQKKIIELDHTWGKEDKSAGMDGMNLARQMAVISYRSYKIFQLSQAQNTIISNSADEADDKSRYSNVESYLQYQGDKFLSRFNAFSYCILLDLMNHHDVSKGFSNIDEALSTITASTLLVGIDSDVLFPIEDIKKTKSRIRHSMYKEISSVYGHDAFLIEHKQLDDIIQNYFYLNEG